MNITKSDNIKKIFIALILLFFNLSIDVAGMSIPILAIIGYVLIALAAKKMYELSSDKLYKMVFIAALIALVADIFATTIAPIIFKVSTDIAITDFTTVGDAATQQALIDELALMLKSSVGLTVVSSIINIAIRVALYIPLALAFAKECEAGVKFFKDTKVCLVCEVILYVLSVVIVGVCANFLAGFDVTSKTINFSGSAVLILLFGLVILVAAIVYLVYAIKILVDANNVKNEVRNKIVDDSESETFGEDFNN